MYIEVKVSKCLRINYYDSAENSLKEKVQLRTTSTLTNHKD